MKKEIGRFLILAFGLGLVLFFGSAVEGLLGIVSVLGGCGVCLGGCWLSAHFLLHERVSRRRNAIHVDFSGSGRAA